MTQLARTLEMKDKKRNEARKAKEDEEKKRLADIERAAEIKRLQDQMAQTGGLPASGSGAASSRSNSRFAAPQAQISDTEAATIEGDLMKEAAPYLGAAVVATTAVAGLGLWLWKIRNRLTKGPQ